MPDAVIAVFTDQQAAVRQLHDSDRAPPNLAGIRTQHPTGEDFAHGAGRFSILEGDEDDGLPDALRTIPGSVEGEESSALVFRGKLLAGVEQEIQHRDMRT